MKNSIPRDFKPWITDKIHWFQRYFFLHAWRIAVIVSFAKEDFEHGDDTIAKIDTDDSYMMATITFSKTAVEIFRRGEKSRLVQTICHEMSHILTDPLYKLAVEGVTNTSQKFLEDIRERQTQHISSVILQGVPAKVLNT